MANLMKTMAIGSSDSLANLNATKVMPQNTIARVTLKMTQNLFKLKTIDMKNKVTKRNSKKVTKLPSVFSN